MPAFFAIFSAFLYALCTVLTKRGMRHASPATAVMISLLGGFLAVLLFCLFFKSLDLFLTRASYFFLAAGIIGPFFGRTFLYKSIDRVGAALSATLFQDRTLFAVLSAIILLEERITLVIGFGIVLMLVGTTIVSFEHGGGQIGTRWSKRDLLFPIAAGACYGISQVFRKMGLNITLDPMVGVMVQSVGAVLVMPLLILPNQHQAGFISKKPGVWVLFLGIGFLQMMAQWCFFKALENGTVVVVSPLSSLNIFFVLLLAALFLKQTEKVTLRIVIGAILMVAATVIITLKP